MFTELGPGVVDAYDLDDAGRTEPAGSPVVELDTGGLASEKLSNREER
ncbi:hypothetical protein ACFYTF_16885 [Nocardia thailandica]|uniref:Uncharacterized protein n=1 Tax=Nocardia thailandica TaxID=257275 RepID=A0ABW6PQ17_9NOCA